MCLRVTKNEVAVLEKTLDIIQTYGWTQGQTGSEEIGYCIMGAELKALSVASYRISQHELREIYQNALGFTPRICWNDQTDRTKEEVIDVLQKTIKYAKSQLSVAAKLQRLFSCLLKKLTLKS
jgi:hypothetical protein